MKLATHFKRSKTVGFQFSSRASPDGFSIERYEKKREYFSLPAVKFESRALRFSGGKLLSRWVFQKNDSTHMVVVAKKEERNGNVVVVVVEEEK